MSQSGPFYSYRIDTPVVARPRVSTSRSEIAQIGIAFAVLTLDLLIIVTESSFAFGNPGVDLFRKLASPFYLSVAASAALTGFVVHELAHKIVAQRRGFWAEFRMSVFGLVVSVMTAFAGLLWAAPGATVVSGMSPADRTGWGRTSLAGPLSNVVFSAAFYAGAVGTYLAGYPVVDYQALLLLAWINGWFGTFNLIPLGPLDGRKVLRWNAGAWVGAICLTGALAALSILAYLSLNPLFFL